MNLNRLAQFALSGALFAAVIPAVADARPLVPEERLGLRCGAAFAMVAAGQSRGDPAMKGFPPMAARGRDFFVRLSAQLMDQAGLTREAVAAAAREEADALRRNGGPAPAMPVCLRILNAQPPLKP